MSVENWFYRPIEPFVIHTQITFHRCLCIDFSKNSSLTLDYNVWIRSIITCSPRLLKSSNKYFKSNSLKTELSSVTLKVKFASASFNTPIFSYLRTIIFLSMIINNTANSGNNYCYLKIWSTYIIINIIRV